MEGNRIMGWLKVAERVDGRLRKPASVKIHKRIDGLAVCTVSFRARVAPNWRRGDKVALLIGTEQASGRIRLLRNAAPAIVAVKLIGKSNNDRGFVVQVGHVPQLGNEARAKLQADATLIDPDTIEVVLPDWDARALTMGANQADGEAANASAGDDEGADDSDGHGKNGRGAERDDEDSTVTKNGVVVSFAHNNECIVFGGRELEIAPDQARLLGVLLEASPNPVHSELLIERVMDGAGAKAQAQLRALVADLMQPLASLGLLLRSVPNAGVALHIKNKK